MYVLNFILPNHCDFSGNMVQILLVVGKMKIFYWHQKNSVALARKRTIPTERPPLVGEVVANF
jgi:hypothetical protein